MQRGAAHSVPCCPGAVLAGSLLRSLEVQPVINSIMGCFIDKASLPCRAPGFLERSTGAFLDVMASPSAHGGPSAPPAWLLPLLLLAQPHTSPFPQGNCMFLLTCPQMASLVFPLLGKKFRGCTKFPYCNRNLGVPLGRTPQWRVGKRGNVLRKELLRVFLQKTRKYFTFKALCTNFGFL